MDMKQRFSLFTATVLPLFAFGYLLISPPKTHADTGCPDQSWYDDSAGANGTCPDGHDNGVQPGHMGFFIFCKADPYMDSGDGPGDCYYIADTDTYCVDCWYGAS